MNAVKMLLTGMALLLVGCSNIPDSPKEEFAVAAMEGQAACTTFNPKAYAAYQAGIEADKREQFDEAMTLYQSALSQDPGFCDVMDNMGRLYRIQGDYDRAIEMYRQSLAVNPDNPVANMNLAVAFQAKGDIDSAIIQYDQMRDAEPGDPESYYGLGVIYFDQHQYHQSLENMQVAERIYTAMKSPYLHQAQVILGMTYFRLGDCQATVRYLELVLPRYEDDPDINYSLGVCHLTEAFYDKQKASSLLEKFTSAGGELPKKLKAILKSKHKVYLQLVDDSLDE